MRFERTVVTRANRAVNHALPRIRLSESSVW